MTVFLASGVWSFGSGPALRGLVVEFVSPRYFYEVFGKTTPLALQGEPPELGWLYAVVGLFYLAVLVFFLWRFRYVEQLRAALAERRLRKERWAERRRLIAAADAEVSGVSYEAFHYLGLGNRAFDEGRYEEALEAYEEAGRSSPRLPAAWVGRGAALGRLKRHSEAGLVLREALELEADNSEALVNLGLAALASDDVRSAAEAFGKAVSLDPSCARAHYGLAVLAAMEGLEEKVLAHLERALKLLPSLREEARREPSFARLAGSERFGALVRVFGPSGSKLRRTG